MDKEMSGNHEEDDINDPNEEGPTQENAQRVDLDEEDPNEEVPENAADQENGELEDDPNGGEELLEREVTNGALDEDINGNQEEDANEAAPKSLNEVDPNAEEEKPETQVEIDPNDEDPNAEVAEEQDDEDRSKGLSNNEEIRNGVDEVNGGELESEGVNKEDEKVPHPFEEHEHVVKEVVNTPPSNNRVPSSLASRNTSEKRLKNLASGAGMRAILRKSSVTPIRQSSPPIASKAPSKTPRAKPPQLSQLDSKSPQHLEQSVPHSTKSARSPVAAKYFGLKPPREIRPLKEDHPNLTAPREGLLDEERGKQMIKTPKRKELGAMSSTLSNSQAKTNSASPVYAVKQYYTEPQKDEHESNGSSIERRELLLAMRGMTIKTFNGLRGSANPPQDVKDLFAAACRLLCGPTCVPLVDVKNKQEWALLQKDSSLPGKLFSTAYELPRLIAGGKIGRRSIQSCEETLSRVKIAAFSHVESSVGEAATKLFDVLKAAIAFYASRDAEYKNERQKFHAERPNNAEKVKPAPAANPSFKLKTERALELQVKKPDPESYIREVMFRSLTPVAKRAKQPSGVEAMRSIERATPLSQERAAEVARLLKETQCEVSQLRLKEQKAQFEAQRDALRCQTTAERKERERATNEFLRKEREFALQTRLAEKKARDEELRYRREDLARTKEVKQKAREEWRIEAKMRASHSLTDAQWRTFLHHEEARRKKEELTAKAEAIKAEKFLYVPTKKDELQTRLEEVRRTRDVTMSFDMRRLKSERDELERSFHLMEVLSQKRLKK